jgi:hypothetical protein
MHGKLRYTLWIGRLAGTMKRDGHSMGIFRDFYRDNVFEALMLN